MKIEVRIPPNLPYLTFMKLAHIALDLDCTLEFFMHTLSNGLGFKPSFGPIQIILEILSTHFASFVATPKRILSITSKEHGNLRQHYRPQHLLQDEDLNVDSTLLAWKDTHHMKDIQCFYRPPHLSKNIDQCCIYIPPL